jgi:hypothetical protein
VTPLRTVSHAGHEIRSQIFTHGTPVDLRPMCEACGGWALEGDCHCAACIRRLDRDLDRQAEYVRGELS